MLREIWLWHSVRPSNTMPETIYFSFNRLTHRQFLTCPLTPPLTGCLHQQRAVAQLSRPASCRAKVLQPDLAPLKNVSLAEWFNSDRGNGNDENIKGALHARIQARGSAPGGQRPKHRGGGAHAGRGRPDAVQLGQGPSPGQAHRSLSSKAPVSAEQMEISRLRAELARVKMERDILGKATAYFARGSI